MNEPPKLFVLVDDKRDTPDEESTVIIRDPRIAFDALCRLSPIHTLAMDNDMGHGWEFEGRNILKKFLAACEPWLGSGQGRPFPNPDYPTFVMLVTSNGPAAIDMAGTLRQHGYTREGVDRWVKL